MIPFFTAESSACLCRAASAAAKASGPAACFTRLPSSRHSMKYPPSGWASSHALHADMVAADAALAVEQGGGRYPSAVVLDLFEEDDAGLSWHSAIPRRGPFSLLGRFPSEPPIESLIRPLNTR